MINTAKIRIAREKKGFSQEYMASKLNISQPVYARMENGKKKVDTSQLFAIAHELDENVESFFDENHPLVQNGHNMFKDNSVNHTNIYYAQKELYEEHIALLREEVESMRKEREKFLEIIQTKLQH